MQDLDRSTRCATALRDLGVRIALDDFGSGYSSLGYLHRIPIENLKLDRSFVHNIGQSIRCVHMVSSVIELARTLGIHTTIEGIENQAQLDVARKARCERVQGFLLGKPVTASELSTLVSKDAVTATSRFFSTLLPHPESTGAGRHVLLGDSGPLPTWPATRVRMPHADTLRRALR